MNWSKFFFVLGGSVCLVLRIFMIFTNMNPETGFYLSNGFTLSFYHTIFGLSLTGIIIYGLYFMKPWGFEVKRPNVLSITIALCGSMILYTSAFDFLKYLREMFLWNNPMDLLKENLPNVLLELLVLLIGLSAGASFLSYAISGNKTLRRSGLLITPAIWTMIYTLEQFMEYPQIADMSDRLLWLLTLLFFSLAMIGQARVIRNVKPEKGVKYLCAFGYACALCGLVLGISQLVTFQHVSTLKSREWILAACLSVHALTMASSCVDSNSK